MEVPEPQKEHQWLQRLVGKWTYESECSMGQHQPSVKNTGRETVRSLGGLWTIGEWSSDVSDGGSSDGGSSDGGSSDGGSNDCGSCDSIMTLGYDPKLQRFVGTFITSMLTHLWPYTGTLDSAGRVLTLDSEGPSFAGDGTLAKYQDIIEFLDDDHRTLSSQVLGPDGQWQSFMKADFRRTM